MEKLWGLDPLTKRDAAANDLFDTLDMQRIAERNPRPAPTLPVVNATEEELYGPPCKEGYKSGVAHSPSSGQSELEAFMDARYRGGHLDRRDQADELYEKFVEDAQRRGLLEKKA